MARTELTDEEYAKLKPYEKCFGYEDREKRLIDLEMNYMEGGFPAKDWHKLTAMQRTYAMECCEEDERIAKELEAEKLERHHEEEKINDMNEDLHREQERELEMRQREIELEEADRDAERSIGGISPEFNRRKAEEEEKYLRELGLE